MSSPAAGLALLFVIIGFRLLVSYWKRRRLAAEIQRGSEAMRADDMTAAAEAFGKCVKLMPTWAGARLSFGVALARLGRLDEAEEQLRLAAQLEPRQPRGHLELGYFYALCRPDRKDDAVSAFAAAVGYDPDIKQNLAQDARLGVLREYQPFQDLLR